MHFLPGFFSPFGDISLFSIIQNAGLSSGLAVCLDAGDEASYTSGQTWSDTSGNSTDYYRGLSASVGADDPTFNGTAGGLEDTVYWSFDGADFFFSTAAHSFTNDWSNDGAKYTILAVIYTPASLTARNDIFFAETDADFVRFALNSTDKLSIDNSAAEQGVTSSNTADLGAWNFCAASIDENGGASGSFVRLQTTVTTDDMANASPVGIGGDSSIGGSTASADKFESGARLSMIAIWNGVALTTTQIQTLYDRIKTHRHSTLP